jgi:hypothetical protein
MNRKPHLMRQTFDYTEGIKAGYKRGLTAAWFFLLFLIIAGNFIANELWAVAKPWVG